MHLPCKLGWPACLRYSSDRSLTSFALMTVIVCSHMQPQQGRNTNAIRIVNLADQKCARPMLSHSYLQCHRTNSLYCGARRQPGLLLLLILLTLLQVLRCMDTACAFCLHPNAVCSTLHVPSLAYLPVINAIHMCLVSNCSAQTGRGGNGGNGASALSGNSVAVGGL